MKKRLPKRILSLLLALTFVITGSLSHFGILPAIASTGSRVYYSEDFESGYAVGDNVNWTPRNSGNTTTTLKIDSDSVMSANNRVLTVDQPSTVGSSQWFTKVFSDEGLEGKFEITFDVKASDAGNAFFFLTDAANSKSIIQLCIRDNGYFCLDTADGFPWNHKITDTFEQNKWYGVKIIVDTAEKSLSVSVDNNEAAVYSFREAAANLGALRIGCGGGTTDNVSIDNIIVKDYVPEQSDAEEEGVSVIYEQDFSENGINDFTNATNTSGAAEVVDASQLEGASGTETNNVLKINKTSSGGGSYLLNHDLGKILNKGIVTVTVKMMPSSENAVSYFLMTDSGNNAVAQFGFYDTRGIAYQIGDTVVPCGDYNANQWYEFCLVFDAEARVYNIYVDGEAVAENVSYSKPADISRIRIGMYNFSTGSVYYDDISVIQDSTPLTYDDISVAPIITMAGVAPVLPTTVTAANRYGFEKEFSVSWETVDASKYASEGNFTVNGELEDGTPVSVNVTVAVNAVQTIYIDPTDFTKNETTSEISFSKVLESALDCAYERVWVTTKVKVNSKTFDAYARIADENGNALAEITFYSDKETVCVRNYGGTNAVGYYGFDTYSADTWYDLEFIFYPAQQRYHVYLNGVCLMKNLAYTTLGGDIAQIQFGYENANGAEIEFDQTKIITDITKADYVAPAFDITTVVDKAPVLPELVNITFADDFVDTLKVTWDNFSNDLYKTEKDFVVNGTATSFRSDAVYSVQAKVTVRKNSSTVFYVDPINGKDSNSGTSKSNAFRTIEAAQAAVRNVNDNMDGDINVYLLSGTHYITEAIVFDSEDSGSNGYYVKWQADEGETPIISGGKEVNGWQKVDGKNYYVASVPTSDGYLDYFRQLYVDGERAMRASGAFINATGFVSQNGVYTGLKFKTSDLADTYTNVEDIIVGHISSFKYDEWHVSGIESGDSTTIVYCNKDNDGLFGWRANTGYCQLKDKYFIINAIEELDSAGEWYLDRSEGKIYYYPYSDQDMSSVISYVTVMEDDQLVRIEGTSSSPVCNITLEGILFEYSNWTYTKDYSIGGSQAEALWGINGLVDHISYGYQIPGAIRLNHTENIQINNNVLRHLAACGIQVYNDAVNTLIEGNVTYDTTGAGIAVGRFCGTYLNDYRNATETENFTADNLESRVSDTVVRNNIVTDTGRDFLQATGISLMSALRTTVINNEVDNTSYMGIHTRLEVAGYYLTRTDATYNGNSVDVTQNVGQNIIAYNKVSEANWAHKYGMNDNAAIYNFGPSVGTLIYRNCVNSESSADWGMYNDDNSHNVIWQENVISGKNVYMSPRCVDKNTIVMKDNYGVNWVLDEMCVMSGNASSYSSSEAIKVIDEAGVLDETLSEKLPDVENYHEIYKNYDNLNYAGGKITDGNDYFIAIESATGTNTQADHPAKDAFDGYLNSYWGSGTNFPETIIFTLAEESEIYNAEIYWYDPIGRYYQYKMYVSTDGTDADDFMLVCDRSENNTKGYTVDYLDNVKAKYVKVEITYSSLNSAAIREIVFNKQSDNVTNVTLNRDKIIGVIGQTVELSATVLPSHANNTLLWTSSDETVATVDKGVVTIVGVGTATITVTSVNGISDSCEVVAERQFVFKEAVVTYTFDDGKHVLFDANGNVSIGENSGKDGTGGLVIKDTYNALEWNGGVQSPENSAIRDEAVSGKIDNPLKGNTNILTKGFTVAYDRYMSADHNGYESIVRFGDYDMTIQSGWFMFEPATYAGMHFCFNRDREGCVSTPVGEWVNEIYTFDPETDTVSLYRNGVLIHTENVNTEGTQINEGEIAEMMKYLASCDDITFGGAASWFSTLGVTLDNFALFDYCLTAEEVDYYQSIINGDNDDSGDNNTEGDDSTGDENAPQTGTEVYRLMFILLMASAVMVFGVIKKNKIRR